MSLIVALGSVVHVGVIIEDTTTALASLGLEVKGAEVTIGEVTFLGDEGDVLGGVVTFGCI